MYDYDRFGNRWHQNGPHAPQFGFDANNRIVAGSGVAYDAAGNTINDGSHTYAYDAEGRVSQVDGGNTASYVYDAEGRRVRKTTGGTSVDFLDDLAGHEIAEINSSGGWNRGEVYACGRHLATYANGTTYFIHADWLGTERARSDVSGTLCETITSLPFGDNMVTSGDCSDVSPMHFTGKEHDNETNLDNFGARYDSSSMGRFTSPGPLQVSKQKFIDPQQWNRYSYGRNNPLHFVDPTGKAIELTGDEEARKNNYRRFSEPREKRAAIFTIMPVKMGNTTLEPTQTVRTGRVPRSTASTRCLISLAESSKTLGSQPYSLSIPARRSWEPLSVRAQSAVRVLQRRLQHLR
jgi:RHS repeat-associated protein